ncbi:hypothetical protein MATL_G00109430 [Megalops atlanticus]|uniref:Uncharacterized protein n=1 Tax=Megalops atlanticus TaxID=7932 RepID=A0A9D3TDW6_MEGAT|nr:hypothetical protein MATL_G00109430 [Megalops atlanticus]
MLRNALTRISTYTKRRVLTSLSLRQPYCSNGPRLTDSTRGVKVLYDGECPICVKEIRFLQYLQKHRPAKIEFVDISMQDYDGRKYGGITYEMAMEEMHVIDEHDKVHRGIPAFTVMYSTVGLGWLGNFMSWSPIRPLLDRLYAIFAKNRLKWTGRDACTTGTCHKKQP